MSEEMYEGIRREIAEEVRRSKLKEKPRGRGKADPLKSALMGVARIALLPTRFRIRVLEKGVKVLRDLSEEAKQKK